MAWAWRLLVDRQPEPLHLVVCLPMRSLVTQTVRRLKTYFDALKAEKPEIKESAATVVLTTAFGDEKHKVTATLQEVDGVWLLDAVK